MSGPNARIVSGIDQPSSGTGRGSLALRSLRRPSTRMPRAIGSTNAKIQRHEPSCSSTPDSVGPTAGATEMTIEMLPIIWPRACGGTRCMIVVISSGIITAVPDACTMRPPSRMANVGATAAMSVPALNRAMARVNTVRVGSRSRSQPVTGMTTAIVSMNAVVSHCAARSVTPKSDMIRASATFIVVSLRITTNAATSRMAMIDRWPLPESGVSDAPGTGWIPVAVEVVGADMGLLGCSVGTVSADHARRPTVRLVEVSRKFPCQPGCRGWRLLFGA